MVQRVTEITLPATLNADTAAHVHRIVEDAQRNDGVAALSEQAVAAIDSDAVAHVVATVDGLVAGYANVTAGRDGDPSMIEAVVDVEHRGRGIGHTLMESAWNVAGTSGRAWAHGNLSAAQALAKSIGVQPRRELMSMRRPLGEHAEPLPVLDVPCEVVVRTYSGPADDAELLRVNNAAFDWHPEQGGWSQDEIDARVGAAWFDPKGLFLACDAQDSTRLLGFHWTKVHPAADDEGALGEVYIVGIDPAAQGRGLGRILTLAGITYLESSGLSTVELYVEGDNDAALHTYHRLGFTQHSIDVAYGR